MPARLPTLAWATRTALIAVLLPLLTDCGPKRNEFAPPCPQAAYLADAAELNRYRPGAASGGNDVTDLILHGRVAGLSGACKPGDTNDKVAVSLSVVLELTRGPAMVGRATDVEYFVAITDGNSILDKRVFTSHVEFPDNVDHAGFQSGEIDLALPVSATKSAAAYGVLVGFQLTPDELVRNRALERR